MNRFALLSAVALLPVLGGCATTSFAPPKINSAAALVDDGECSGSITTGSGGTRKGHGLRDRNTNTGGIQPITPNTVAGAQQLIQNYLIAYGCAADELANGRQAFQIPSALALAGGAAAAAFGAGPDVAIATGAGAALFNHGNSYYAPQAKGRLVAAAHAAVNCISQEASGVTALNVSAAEAAANNTSIRTMLQRAGSDRSVSFSPETQYFQLVRAALINVHSVLRERMTSIGSYSPDALASEIRELSKAEAEAGSEDTRVNIAKSFTNEPDQPLSREAQALATGLVELEKLQPALKLCVLQAKAG